jgi:hypothetical protein
LGSAYHKDVWNIAAFAAGTLLFLAWTIRVENKPQMAVNVAAFSHNGSRVIQSLWLTEW